MAGCTASSHQRRKPCEQRIYDRLLGTNIQSINASNFVGLCVPKSLITPNSASSQQAAFRIPISSSQQTFSAHEKPWTWTEPELGLSWRSATRVETDFDESEASSSINIIRNCLSVLGVSQHQRSPFKVLTGNMTWTISQSPKAWLGGFMCRGPTMIFFNLISRSGIFFFSKYLRRNECQLSRNILCVKSLGKYLFWVWQIKFVLDDKGPKTWRGVKIGKSMMWIEVTLMIAFLPIQAKL